MSLFVVWSAFLACSDASRMEEMEERIEELEIKVQTLEEQNTHGGGLSKRDNKTAIDEEDTEATSGFEEYQQYFPVKQIQSTEKGGYIIPQSLLDDMKKHLDKLSAQVRVSPHKTEGVLDGYRLSGIRRQSIFWKMGFKNGDILNKINDTPITSIQDVQSAHAASSGSKNLTVYITRRREPIILTYTIE